MKKCNKIEMKDAARLELSRIFKIMIEAIIKLVKIK